MLRNIILRIYIAYHDYMARRRYEGMPHYHCYNCSDLGCHKCDPTQPNFS